MGCRYCGSKTRAGRPFCNRGCHKGWLEANRTAPGSGCRAVVASDDLTPAEKAERKDLLDRARGGDRAAGKVLRKQYGLTALWNGKRLIKLRG